jgi:hypothetical protein
MCRYGSICSPDACQVAFGALRILEGGQQGLQRARIHGEGAVWGAPLPQKYLAYHGTGPMQAPLRARYLRKQRRQRGCMQLGSANR